MRITTHSPIYRKAFEQYLRRGTSIEMSLKAADEHETPFYIWHTVGDDRVRPSHEANNGKIFAWSNPPGTGHPGEEENCRCSAEPVTVVDTTPLDILALLAGGGLLIRAGRIVRTGGQIIRRVWRNEPPPKPPESPPPLPKPEGIPKHWEKIPSNKGEGVKYRDPNNPGNEVRVQRGNPNSSFPGQRQDYVVWKRNGQHMDKYGNQMPGKSFETHIPVDEFKFDPELFK